jgi:predicted transposase/invertase (TIGR01784 family)
MRERIIFYLAKLVTDQIEKGMGYKSIKRSICLIITDYVLAPETDACHDQFLLYSELTKTRFSDIVEIDTLELPKVPANWQDEKLWQWTKFLAGKTMEDFMALAETSPVMKKAVGVLMELNASQRRRMLADARQKARWDEQARFEGAYTNGKEEGVREGKKEQAAMIAKNAIAQGLPIETISAITGLSVDAIQRLNL